MKQMIYAMAARINRARSNPQRTAMPHTLSLAAIGVTAPEFL
ncbi:MAG: hypothetical protein WAT93_10655 [Pontixanthobacter sp.]